MFVFTDGSLLDSAGAGWHSFWGSCKRETAQGRLNLPHHEVFDAEATGALEGLHAAGNSIGQPGGHNATDRPPCRL